MASAHCVSLSPPLCYWRWIDYFLLTIIVLLATPHCVSLSPPLCQWRWIDGSWIFLPWEEDRRPSSDDLEASLQFPSSLVLFAHLAEMLKIFRIKFKSQIIWRLIPFLPSLIVCPLCPLCFPRGQHWPSLPIACTRDCLSSQVIAKDPTTQVKGKGQKGGYLPFHGQKSEYVCQKLCWCSPICLFGTAWQIQQTQTHKYKYRSTELQSN